MNHPLKPELSSELIARDERRAVERSAPLELPDRQPLLSRLGVTGSLRRELEMLLAEAPADATPGELRALIVERNVAGKASAAQRIQVWQDKYEAEHGPILDPDLVDPDGIIPLVPCGDEPTAEQRVRRRLERQFREEGAEQSAHEFGQWVGRELGDWLRRDFFKRHVQQFKQRPIAWHFVSPDRTFEAFVLYHRLSRATLQKLRAQYAGGLIARLRAEQERARQRTATAEVSKLQLQIEDVEEFRARLEKIERGDELKYRVRCRWKGEEAVGRPGPYAPDIDDGVKVNIRPFQEAGLLALREVIKKW